jgi:hypothetical protein
MNSAEVYKLDCVRCCETIELPACPPRSIEQAHCPRCGTVLQIDWRAVGARADQATSC